MRKTIKKPNGGQVFLPNPNSFVAPIQGVNPAVQQFNLNTKPVDVSSFIQVSQNRDAIELRKQAFDLKKRQLDQAEGAEFSKLRTDLFKLMKEDYGNFQEDFGLDQTAKRHRGVIDEKFNVYSKALQDMSIATSSKNARKAMEIAAKLESDLFSGDEYNELASLEAANKKWKASVDAARKDKTIGLDLTSVVDIEDAYRKFKNGDIEDFEIGQFDLGNVTYDKEVIDLFLKDMDAKAKAGEKNVSIVDDPTNFREVTTIDFTDTTKSAEQVIDYLNSFEDGRKFLSAKGYNMKNEAGRQAAIDVFDARYKAISPPQVEQENIVNKTKEQMRLSGSGNPKERNLIEISEEHAKIYKSEEQQAIATQIIQDYGEEGLLDPEVLKIVLETSPTTGKGFEPKLERIRKVLGIQGEEEISLNSSDMVQYNRQSTREDGVTYDAITKLVGDKEKFVVTNDTELKKLFGSPGKNTGENVNSINKRFSDAELPKRQQSEFITIPEERFKELTTVGKVKIKPKKDILKKLNKNPIIKNMSQEDKELAARFIADEELHKGFFTDVLEPPVESTYEQLESRWFLEDGIDSSDVNSKIKGDLKDNTEAKIKYLIYHHGSVGADDFLKNGATVIGGNKNADKEVKAAFERIDRFISANEGASFMDLISSVESNNDPSAVYTGTADSSAITQFQILYKTHKKAIQDYVNKHSKSTQDDIPAAVDAPNGVLPSLQTTAEIDSILNKWGGN